MANNIAAGSFPFRRANKPFSIFRVQKNGRFYEATTKWLIQNATTTFKKILDHLTWTMS